MKEDKLKQLELLIAQAASRLHTMQHELTVARQKIRLQEQIISRLREIGNETTALREWKRNTVSALKKLETRIDKELNKAQKF